MKEYFWTDSMSSEPSSYQNQTKTQQQKRKLKNITDEHRYKNPQQNMSTLNLIIL